jgi:hypothetical protein
VAPKLRDHEYSRATAPVRVTPGRAGAGPGSCAPAPAEGRGWAEKPVGRARRQPGGPAGDRSAAAGKCAERERCGGEAGAGSWRGRTWAAGAADGSQQHPPHEREPRAGSTGSCRPPSQPKARPPASNSPSVRVTTRNSAAANRARAVRPRGLARSMAAARPSAYASKASASTEAPATIADGRPNSSPAVKAIRPRSNAASWTQAACSGISEVCSATGTKWWRAARIESVIQPRVNRCTTATTRGSGNQPAARSGATPIRPMLPARTKTSALPKPASASLSGGGCADAVMTPARIPVRQAAFPGAWRCLPAPIRLQPGRARPVPVNAQARVRLPPHSRTYSPPAFAPSQAGVAERTQHRRIRNASPHPAAARAGDYRQQRRGLAHRRTDVEQPRALPARHYHQPSSNGAASHRRSAAHLLDLQDSSPRAGNLPQRGGQSARAASGRPLGRERQVRHAPQRAPAPRCPQPRATGATASSRALPTARMPLPQVRAPGGFGVEDDAGVRHPRSPGTVACGPGAAAWPADPVPCRSTPGHPGAAGAPPAGGFGQKPHSFSSGAPRASTGGSGHCRFPPGFPVTKRGRARLARVNDEVKRLGH